jgi:sugar diacid utilization regulator
MLPTLAEVLDLAAVRAGAPRVVAAPSALDRPVRWVHVIELADAARLLHGGELVLSTGIALPDDAEAQARYVAELAAVGVAGLAVELVRRYTARLPAGLVAAAEEHRLPLIAFGREVRFVEITEAVHARIIDSQLTELRAATQVHEVFTGLSVAAASPAEIIEAAARLSARPVVLADLTHTVLASAGLPPHPAKRDHSVPAASDGSLPARPLSEGPPSEGRHSSGPLSADPAGAGRPGASLTDSLLADPGPAGFPARCRQALARAVPAGPLLANPPAGGMGQADGPAPATDPEAEVLSDDGRAEAASPARNGTGGGLTVFDPETGWLITPVGAHGEVWGRVILAAGRPPESLDVMLAERAATALALGRLQARQRESLERQAHRTLIAAIVSPSGPADTGQAATRARALGLPTTGRLLIALVARLPAAGPGLSAQARILAVADAMAAACRAERVPAIVGSLDDLRAGALLSLPAGTDPDPALTAVSQRTQRMAFAPAGAGPTEMVLAAGSAAGSIHDAARSFAEARQVADAAAGPDAVAGTAGRPGRPFLRLADLRLAGLLQLLRDDPRVQAFAEREAGPLLAYDAQHGTNLTEVLTAYLDAGGNKALTAQRTHLARPTLYERLAHIERLLEVSLDSPRSRASLHVALLAQATTAPG